MMKVKFSMVDSYIDAYKKSITNPESFWSEHAQDCHWYKKWEKVLDDTEKPFYRWFSGGQVNTCYNALDFHIENGIGDQLAMIYDSPVTDTIKKFTYRQLRVVLSSFNILLLLYIIFRPVL